MATERNNYGQEQVLLKWESEERLAMKKSRDFYSTMVVLAILVAIVLFFIEGIMPVLVVAAIVFVVFALSRAEPRVVENQITNRGVVSAGQKHLWEDLLVYWIDGGSGRKILHVLTKKRWPVQLVLLLPSKGGVSEEDIKKTISQYLNYEEPEESRMDKIVMWLNEKVPLE